MELPDNWDKAESAYNKHYDPYGEDDGSVSEICHCESCDSYIHVDDIRICDTCNVEFCEWCAEIRDGHINEKCKVRSGDAINIPF